MLRYSLIFVLILLVAACGRISTSDHEAVLDDLEATQIDLAESQRTNEEMSAEIDTLNERIAVLQEEQKSLKEEKDALETDLEAAKQDLQDKLEANRQELEQLRKARAQTEERLAAYRKVAEQLASMVEAGQLSITIRQGRMVINLDNEILFASGRTAIQQEGRDALQQLSEILKEIDDRNFVIAGHTDNVPIRSQRFSSNWELSTARAVEVVKFLEEQGVNPKVLAAAGYGEFDPIASNEDAESRALNRRIEIILMPSIDELPTLPEDILDES